MLPTTKTIAALTLLALAAGPAVAQPAGSEATHQSSTMGLPTAGTEGANNGVGTAGSLDRNNGSASSTVAGMHGSSTGIKTDGSNKGVHGPMENDPALGGGEQRK